MITHMLECLKEKRCFTIDTTSETRQYFTRARFAPVIDKSYELVKSTGRVLKKRVSEYTIGDWAYTTVMCVVVRCLFSCVIGNFEASRVSEICSPPFVYRLCDDRGIVAFIYYIFNVSNCTFVLLPDGFPPVRRSGLDDFCLTFDSHRRWIGSSWRLMRVFGNENPSFALCTRSIVIFVFIRTEHDTTIIILLSSSSKRSNTRSTTRRAFTIFPVCTHTYPRMNARRTSAWVYTVWWGRKGAISVVC